MDLWTEGVTITCVKSLFLGPVQRIFWAWTIHRGGCLCVRLEVDRELGVGLDRGYKED